MPARSSATTTSGSRSCAASDELGQGTVHEYMQVLFQQRSWGPMAESETCAHLEHLRILGEADVDETGPLLRYSFT
ncbi:MAG: hypothetical protein R2713_03495 [Ilumatobacteraceae bacterium]